MNKHLKIQDDVSWSCMHDNILPRRSDGLCIGWSGGTAISAVNCS